MLRRALVCASVSPSAVKLICTSSVAAFPPRERTKHPTTRRHAAILDEHRAIKTAMASQPTIDLEKELADMATQPSLFSDLPPSLVALVENTFTFPNGWAEARTRIARTPGLPASSLYNLLENARSESQPQRPYSDTLEVVLERKSMECDWIEAGEWWDRLREEGSLSVHGARLGVRALVHNGRMGEALEVCEAIVEMVDAADVGILSREASVYKTSLGALVYENSSPHAFRRVFVDLIDSIHHIYRPDMVFQIIDNAELLYGAACIHPKTLGVIMHSAFRAIAADPSFISWRPTELDLMQHYRPTIFRTRRDALMYIIDASEHIPPLDSEAFKWRGTHPGLVARQIFYTVLKAHYPHLCHIQAPIPVPCSHPLKRHLLENVPTYFHFNLFSASIWTSFVRLLGRSHLAAEVPFVLAWMKALDITLDAQTAGFAHGLVMRSMGPRACNALMAWIKQWQGPDWKLEYDSDYWAFQTDQMMKGASTFHSGPAVYPPPPPLKKHYIRY
ncbi:hypothetical protein FIBSPDRAFT_873878 [Athelia psychrophila]|uniref:Uncharacterized protein n=1 Tax=Athelia psychrophila TaxID=1759441 RepID=A0A165Y3Q6_9AGAM|nr:hypothetical protein FIBSPDRAFT_873878 [Fibularhizoctonia sp. CBS 109695]